PAPPATLADELRKFAYKTIGADGYPLDDGDKELLDIADRAEAVEKANRDTERELLRAWAERDAAYSENNRVCAALATVTDERNNAWDRLADLQDVREELHAARAEVELLAAQIDRMVETYASEVERLTRERDEARGGRDAINKALSAA
ncbi:hypothetical protein, partial [Corynebacterium glyciniphilum]|uniref:hypothetical protein n=1 Tax=Corynebacterium glyciniphilum TaxID=1404244 RepID=UPI003FCFF439